MSKFLNIFLLTIYFNSFAIANQIEPEIKKTHLEDIFIWKISDELKLSVADEKKFTEISRSLNKKKSEINKKIQETVHGMSQNSSEVSLNRYKKLILEYNQLSISEFDSMKQLLGTSKFINYLKIKNELTTRIKSALVSDRPTEEKSDKTQKILPPPKVIIEKND